MPVDQTLQSGATLQDRWGLGLSGTVSIDPNTEFMLVASFPKIGKSYLFQSNPNALILNIDLGPASYNPLKAGVYPVRHNGEMLGVDGRPLKVLTYNEIKAVKDKLMNLAKADKPRPKQIVIDTVSALRPLLEDWVATQMGKPTFGDCGMSGHAMVKREMIRLGTDLTSHGYGVVYLAHLVYDTAIDGSTGAAARTSQTYQIDLSDSQWRALQVYPTVLATLEKKKVTTTQKVDGKSERVTTTKYFLNIEDTKLSTDSTGSRIQLPAQIELPQTDPWATYERVFREAISQQ